MKPFDEVFTLVKRHRPPIGHKTIPAETLTWVAFFASRRLTITTHPRAQNPMRSFMTSSAARLRTSMPDDEVGVDYVEAIVRKGGNGLTAAELEELADLMATAGDPRPLKLRCEDLAVWRTP